jgi:hypothetical protein
MDMQLEANEILEALQAEFPKEFTIAVQRVHIKKLEEKLKNAEEFSLVVKEADA